jgi:hypothetical protein
MFRTPLLATVGLLALAATTFAGPAKPHETWASGKIERVDTGAKSLVVTQGTHEMTFVLAADAHLTQGKKSVTPAELGSEVGHTVKVRYTTSGTQRIADRVEVADATPAPTKTAAKK